MIIDFSDNILSIKNLNPNMKPRHFSQLNDWGFKKEPNNGFYLDFKAEIIFQKLIHYFKKNDLPFTLTDSSTIFLEQLNTINKKYHELRNAGKKFKDGEIDQVDYKKHLTFLSANIPRELKDHQKKASYHLWLIGNGANFSVPGSGKTTVVLTVYERLRIKGEVNMLFVIGPPACFGPWKYEFEVVLGRKAISNILAGGNKSERKSEYYKRENFSELYLTTFQTLLNDQQEVVTFLTNKNVKAYVVIDEAHYIKQINGNWANAVLNIAKHSKYRCILTGTPIPKSYSDLYNLFDFIWPENNPINPHEKATLRIMEETKDFENASHILDSSIGPLFYRVRKTELNLKPQIFKDPEIITMEKNERKIYNAITKKISNYALEDYLKNIDLVEKLRRGRMIRLRQCLSYTKLLSTAIEDYKEDLFEKDKDLRYIIYNYDKLEIPGKLTRLLTLVHGFQERGKKIVIWAYFIGTIKLIEKHLKQNGYKCKKIIGETPIERTAIEEEETREKIRNEFIDANSGLDILLANPAACAESISLHKTCQIAIYYDLSYNCAQYLQSLDRIHRVGGSEDQEAYYYFLQYDNTIDSDILNNLKEKAQKMYDIIEKDYNIYSLDMFDESDELTAYERLFLQQK